MSNALPKWDYTGGYTNCAVEKCPHAEVPDLFESLYSKLYESMIEEHDPNASLVADRKGSSSIESIEKLSIEELSVETKPKALLYSQLYEAMFKEYRPSIAEAKIQSNNPNAMLDWDEFYLLVAFVARLISSEN